MYKKLSATFNFSTYSMIIATITTCVCTSSLFLDFSDFTSFFVMNTNLDSNSIFFSVEEASTVNTEIVARRVGSGLATAGLGGVGTGIGLVFSGLIKGFSRNPSLKDDLFSYAIFGFALTEAIGLFALMMAFMLLYA